MTMIDPRERIELQGSWVGFGFQGGHMYTPEGHTLEPCDMAWWSLTCNIAREWRTMMDEARAGTEPKLEVGGHNVINMRDVLSERRQRRSGKGVIGPAAEVSNVVHMRRGPRSGRRG